MTRRARRPARIAVVIPAYNHADYVGEAIASVLTQDWPELELHVLDDGSGDETMAAAERALAHRGGVRATLATQANAGASQTLNRLVARCDCDLVAILNSDDVFRPGRLRTMAQTAPTGDFLAFTGVAFDPAALVAPDLTFEEWYCGKLAFALSLPSCGFALVSANLAISSSNFLFSRGLFDRVGGFNVALPLTHDWEFLLKALRWTEPRLFPDRLLYYRTHATNTFRKLVDIRIEQSRRALDAYIAWADGPTANAVAPTPAAWPRVFPFFARSCAPAFSDQPVGRFLPDRLLSGSAAAPRPAEGAALAAFLGAAQARTENLLKGTEALLQATSGHWQTMHAAMTSDG